MGIRAMLARRREARAAFRATVEEVADLIDSAMLAYAMRTQGYGRQIPVDLDPEHVLDSCLKVAGDDTTAVAAAIHHRRFDPLTRAYRLQKRLPLDPTTRAQVEYLATLGLNLASSRLRAKRRDY